MENYISILENLLLAFKIPVFNKKAQRYLSSHPKFYFFDAGVYMAIRPKGPLDQPEEMMGHAIETLVAQHLRAWLDYSGNAGELFFWRTKSGLEIDFIIYGEIGFYAIEVKSAQRISLQDLRALKEFRKDYPECQTILIYGGQDKLIRDDILCYPLTSFLLNLIPGNKIY